MTSQRYFADPDFWFVANNVVAAWGRRPLI